MKYIIPSIALLMTTACVTAAPKKTTPPVPFQGVCVSPLINGGVPFPVGENVTFDGSTLRAVSEDGDSEGMLIGASCSLSRPITK